MSKKLTTKEFIKRAVEKHGDKFDYLSFDGMVKPLVIKCNQCSHTSIIPQARHHTENSQGCYLCDAAPNKMTTELFLKRLHYRTDKFKNYDFSEFEYKGTQIKGQVTCSCKNTYKVNPNDLMTGYGCPECGKNKITGRPRHKVSQNDIDALLSRNIRVNLDDYEKTSSHIKATCLKCNHTWSVRWSSLVDGYGCSECVRKRFIKEGWKRQVTRLPKSDNPTLSDKGVLSVSCKTCGKHFTPSVSAIISRIRSYEGKARGENNFYCDLKCRDRCIIYNFKSNCVDPRSKLYVPKTEQEEVRACQTTNLKESQCDDKGYNYCEKCGDIIDVELHHTLEVSKYGKDAINSAGHMLLCAGCHTILHGDC